MVSEELIKDLMNDPTWIYLHSMQEPRDNQLEIVIGQAAPNHSKMGTVPDSLKDRPELAFLAKDSCPVEPTEGCRRFRFCWKHYAAYLVTEEMVGSCGSESDENYEGIRVRKYSKSSFLDHLARTTGAHCGPLIHYKLTCLNHLIDVASVDAPEVSLVDKDSDPD